MQVPKFWAEGRSRRRDKDRQITVQRWGWSDASQAAAQAHADQRAQDALERVAAGQEKLRREPKVAYNGAEGVPIREEIIATHGPTIITRNGYGALCLNTPNVLFADIDLDLDAAVQGSPSNRALLPWFWPAGPLALPLAADAEEIRMAKWGAALGVFVAVGFFVWWSQRKKSGANPYAGDGPAAAAAGKSGTAPDAASSREAAAHARIADFLGNHPDWHLRVYRTPAGFRLLAMHRPFDPTEPATGELFKAIGTDPIFAKMCVRQRCFRARVSPKPWRIGMNRHYAPGVWPVADKRRDQREKWVHQYDQKAQGFAACRFLEAFGSSKVAPEAEAVCRLHDELCGAQSGKPLA